MSNELSTVNTAVATASEALLGQLENLSATGFENVTSKDLAQSILNILQSNSPSCDKKSKEYLDYVTEGQFFDSASKQAFDEITVIPIGFTRSFIEWVPREQGGGFVGKYGEDHPRVREAEQVGNKLILPGGNTLVETCEHHVLLVPNDGGLPKYALIPLSSTQIKHSRRWMSEMTSKVADANGKTVRLPMFAQMYKLASGVESNSKGSWYGLCSINYLGIVPDSLLSTAKEMAEAFLSSTDGGKKANAYAEGAPKPQQQAADTVDISSHME